MELYLIRNLEKPSYFTQEQIEKVKKNKNDLNDFYKTTNNDENVGSTPKQWIEYHEDCDNITVSRARVKRQLDVIAAWVKENDYPLTQAGCHAAVKDLGRVFENDLELRNYFDNILKQVM